MVRSETVSVIIASNAAPRVEFGAEKLTNILQAAGHDARIARRNTERMKGFLPRIRPSRALGCAI
jgi:hypothetical protein